MQNAGIAAKDVIRLSTLNGAAAMGEETQFGSLEKGKLADFLVLSEDPRDNISAFRSVKQIIRGGKRHQQADLSFRDKTE